MRLVFNPIFENGFDKHTTWSKPYAHNIQFIVDPSNSESCDCESNWKKKEKRSFHKQTHNLIQRKTYIHNYDRISKKHFLNNAVLQESKLKMALNTKPQTW